MTGENGTKLANPSGAASSPQVELTRILVWPAFAVIALLLFWKPVHRILNTLPEMVSKSETITVGSVSVRVGKPLSARSSEEIRAELAAMTPDDVKLIVENDLIRESYFRGGDDKARWARIARLGLVEELSAEELIKYQKKYNEEEAYDYGIRPTVKYDRLRQFLIGVVTEVAVQASKASEETASKK